MEAPDLFIVTASECEAFFFLSYFSLKEERFFLGVKVYRDEKAKVVLAVSGIGERAVCRAVALLATSFPGAKEAFWLNFGIAGHSSLAIGELFFANKISHEKNKSSFYPSFIFRKKIERSSLLTVLNPNFSYLEPFCGYDMEAFGFYESCIKVSTLELCHVLKIVSDNPEGKIDFSKKEIVSQIEKKTFLLQQEIETLLSLQRKGNLKKSREEALYQRAKKTWHFSVAQSYLLKDLLQKWQIAIPEKEPLFQANSSKEFLQKLSQTLYETPLDLSSYDGTDIL